MSKQFGKVKPTGWVTTDAHKAELDMLKRRFAMAMMRRMDTGKPSCPAFQLGSKAYICPAGMDPTKCLRVRSIGQRQAKNLAHIVDCWMHWIDQEMDMKPGLSWLDDLLVEAGELEAPQSAT